MQHFQETGAKAFGISTDNGPSQKEFAKQLGLSFPLLSDFVDRKVSQEYGVFIPKYAIAGRVTFAGFQPEARMKTYYAAADLVALPSLEEGWPDVLTESFACGCPWVASDVGGVRDILALTGSGLVVPAGNRAALAASLRTALSRDWDREATAKKMEQWTLDTTARAYVATCEKAAATSTAWPSLKA